uniref:Uncharacterized protein n=1 Tax=Amblyomma triste TaxID=251400 RepID=A0A023GD62_AMBTT
MLGPVVVTYMLNMLRAASCTPFEDDPRYLKNHRASQFLSVYEILFVKLQSRNPILYPYTVCQAMELVDIIGENTYSFKMHVIDPRTRTQDITTFYTRLTTSITAPHRHPNTLSYQTIKEGAQTPFKVMYADRATGCFILTFSQGSFGKGCRLLQTASTVGGAIPPICMDVFLQNCPQKFMQIFHPTCFFQIMNTRI